MLDQARERSLRKWIGPWTHRLSVTERYVFFGRAVLAGEMSELLASGEPAVSFFKGLDSDVSVLTYLRTEFMGGEGEENQHKSQLSMRSFLIFRRRGV